MNPFLSPGTQRGLVLASASPRRRDLLAGLGFEFEVLASDYVEDDAGGAWAPDLAARTHAKGKALAVALARPGALVLGADTIVAVDGRSLGKPEDAGEARTMLGELSGRAHEVVTAVALARAPAAGGEPRERVETMTTRVHFRRLSPAEVEAYLASGEPFDKAGAYGIQGLAAQFVTSIEGCYFNVMGLPLELLTRMLREWGEDA